MIKNALISVSDKTGMVELVKELKLDGVKIISTGGTARVLREAGIDVQEVSDLTGFSECLDGRLKTLHPKIHGGLLAVRENNKHMEEIEKLGIEPIDLVVVNLYPFKQTILREGVTLEEAIENIDIGGPTMLRAAAKNYRHVVVIVDPDDYSMVIEEYRQNRDISLATRAILAYKVFQYTSFYDTLIANYLKDKFNIKDFPKHITFGYELAEVMRYGENSHQEAAFYREINASKGSIVNARQLNGKQLSFNNINDTNGAVELLKEFAEPTVVAVKHANPCGVGSADNIYDAYIKAYNADPISIFGGIIALNREVNEEIAKKINDVFIEIVIAPSYTKEALDILCEHKNVRILELPGHLSKEKSNYDMKKINGGMLVQTPDDILFDKNGLNFVTNNKPTKEQLEDLVFALKVVKHTRSNAIVIAKGGQTLGIGMGQPNRVNAVRIAIENAKDNAKGAVLASDAFFPFKDSVEEAIKAGIEAFILPKGSIKDNESIDVCNQLEKPMIHINTRHFKH